MFRHFNVRCEIPPDPANAALRLYKLFCRMHGMHKARPEQNAARSNGYGAPCSSPSKKTHCIALIPISAGLLLCVLCFSCFGESVTREHRPLYAHAIHEAGYSFILNRTIPFLSFSFKFSKTRSSVYRRGGIVRSQPG